MTVERETHQYYSKKVFDSSNKISELTIKLEKLTEKLSQKNVSTIVSTQIVSTGEFVQSNQLLDVIPAINSPNLNVISQRSETVARSNEIYSPELPIHISKKLCPESRIGDTTMYIKEQLFSNIRFSSNKGILSRKPRSILMHPDSNNELSDLLVTSSLDGAIQFTSIQA